MIRNLIIYIYIYIYFRSIKFHFEIILESFYFLVSCVISNLQYKSNTILVLFLKINKKTFSILVH